MTWLDTGVVTWLLAITDGNCVLVAAGDGTVAAGLGASSGASVAAVGAGDDGDSESLLNSPHSEPSSSVSSSITIDSGLSSVTVNTKTIKQQSMIVKQ